MSTAADIALRGVEAAQADGAAVVVVLVMAENQWSTRYAGNYVTALGLVDLVQQDIRGKLISPLSSIAQGPLNG